ncbi:S8 family serine peptidase [Enterococcus cecorum]|uniref:hypothetical protein n=1 Tax=Enterococcus cecorum TaxID=44008 RepID=UPI0022D79751|nr:hypothetical protein [Enterococcus cecorum]CAI3287097.1 S8 family serine peptidase [Enterococcus cecorum]CAI3296929.1 S8 family serine peptidase [Enterococcus cecorum]CAI3319417.1 S8 family serine peptidase [Enterococcus cecorum]CAI3335117.1 S8 family serine peptidase [Enterococcus cecorum]CAI3351570.1 S8 family serine peptidase [Enterococcus cecorum]
MIKIIYIIKVELPEGYEFLEDPSFKVKNNTYNIKILTLINKTELLNLLKQVADVQDQAKFYNASRDKQVRFNQALLSAQKLITGKEKQEVINREVNESKEKFAALDGAETDLTALTDELVEYPKLVQQANYYNADLLKQVAYDALVRSAKLLSSKEKATQAEVNQLLDKLSEARTALDGKSVVAEPTAEVAETDTQTEPTPEVVETGTQMEPTPEVTETATQTEPVVEASEENDATTVENQTDLIIPESKAKDIAKASEVKDTVLHLSDNKAKMSNSSNAQNNKQVLSSDKNVVKQKTQASSQTALPQSGTKQSSILLGLVSLFVASITLLSGKVLKTKE